MGLISSSAKVVEKYGKKTTADEVAVEFGKRAAGKTIVVTGANCGLGFETARVLAANGATVILCSRSKKNGEEAVQKIRAQHPAAVVSDEVLDLSSFDSIRAFGERFVSSGRPLNILINNAGVMACPLSFTSNGLETQFGVNHVGHFLLTKLLLPVLVRCGTSDEPSRVINLSSMGNWIFAPEEGIQFDNLKGERHYDQWVRYGETKLANILFTRELQKRCNQDHSPVISMSVHPGAILGTNLKRHFDLSNVWRMTSHAWSRPGGFAVINNTFYKNIPQGSATTILTALDPAVVPGEHYADCAVSDLVHPRGYDEKLSTRLWEISEDLIKR